MSEHEPVQVSVPIGTLDYEADLCGNIEQALKGLQGYGNMALELIQNADDAGAATLVFDSRADALVVWNDAEFTSCGSLVGRCPWARDGDPQKLRRPCNFHAISRVGSRSKIEAPDQIGRFGIGFVSVYQITDTPIVRSSETQLTLDPLTRKNNVARIAAIKGTEFELPWASSASDIRAALNASPTPSDVMTGVVAEIIEVLDTSLLFLRHLQRVEVREAGALRLSIDITRTGDQLTLELAPGGSEHWLVLSGDASQTIKDSEMLARFEALKKLDRSRAVSVAVPIDAAPIKGRLFAYLPTQHPTGLPLHVNGDFFPHASRQDIVLKGEGHERYWNEALLATAADVIASNFETLRDTLGPVRLWELGSAALKMRELEAFGEFWTAFSTAAKPRASVWTISAAWHMPEGAHLAPEEMTDAEKRAIAGIGVELLDQSLRPHASALAAVGAGELRLSTVTTALEVRQGAGISPDNPQLKDLWDAIARLVSLFAERPGFAAVLARLKAAPFLIDVDGDPTCPEEVWRIPAGIGPQAVRRHLSNIPIVHEDAAAIPGLATLIDEMAIEDFATALATDIADDEDARRVVGPDPTDARKLYAVLTAFAAHGSGEGVGATLANTPFLRTAKGFIPPSRGQMPGHFRDPTGYFEFVDTALFPPGMDEFARGTLGVDVLSFHQYIDQHLSMILQRGLDRDQYREIVGQITSRKNELDEHGSLARLRDLAFVRTRAGSYARPCDCYYWSAPLEAILGDDLTNWVDSNWMPSASLAPQVRDLFEGRLGMPITVTPRHIVDRLEEMASDGTPDQVAEGITPIMRHVIERWPRFEEIDLDTFRELQDLRFLPAVIDGSRDQEDLYLPCDIFRAGRAPGFASQVAVIDLAPLRRATATVSELLDLLGVPDEPETAVVVAHLQHCMDEGVAPSDLTYAILNERVDEGDDVALITSLEGSQFIYDTEHERFVGADQVFWLPPPFKGYWWQASGRMGQRSRLFTLLGVRDEPGVTNYATLMLQIAAQSDLTVRDLDTHALCVARLCDAVDANDAALGDAIEALRADSSLLTIDGEPIWPEDAIWLDTEQLAEPFGSALNHCLVAPPDVARTSAARLYRHLGVRPLSEIARLRLAAEPDRRAAEKDTDLLRDRADLILWVAPNAASRTALRTLLRDIEIRLTDSLKIQAEIAVFDPPASSPVSVVPAFYEHDMGVLHIKGQQAKGHWPAGFRAILAEVEQLCPLTDMKPLVMTSTLIMQSDTREAAEQALHDSGFRVPTPTDEEAEAGDMLGEEEDVGTESDDGGWREVDEFEVAEADNADEDHELSETDGDLDNVRQDGGDDSYEHTGGETAGGEAGGEGANADGYRSKAGSGGISEQESGKASGSRFGPGGRSVSVGESEEQVSGVGGATYKGDGSRERRARTSRMLSYVSREGDRGPDDRGSASSDTDIGALIDVAAISAVIKYEEQRGWRPEEQPHNNPGYDILSHGPAGERRLIEVKGLENEWTERGVKLSHVQFGMAEQHPEEYWIYVVERARDLGLQRVSAIANPFQKVDEYWFDDTWRALADEGAGAHELNVNVGAKVSHQLWGTGRIVDIAKGGIGIRVKVDFGYQGVKLIPFNSSLKLVD